MSSQSRAPQEGDVGYCQEHPSAYLATRYKEGDIVCSECGLVVGER